MSKAPAGDGSRKRPLPREPSPQHLMDDFDKLRLRVDINSLDTDWAMKDPLQLRELLLRIIPNLRPDEVDSISNELERVCDQSSNIHVPTTIDLRTKEGLSDTMARLSDALIRTMAIAVLKIRRPDSKFVVRTDVKHARPAEATTSASARHLDPGAASGSRAAVQHGGPWPQAGQWSAGPSHSWAITHNQAAYGGHQQPQQFAYALPSGHPTMGQQLLPAHWTSGQPGGPAPSGLQLPPHAAYGPPNAHSIPGHQAPPTHAAYGPPSAHPRPYQVPPGHSVYGPPRGPPPNGPTFGPLDGPSPPGSGPPTGPPAAGPQNP